jgi:membrane protease YdiL (CAAX protease family)
MFRTAVSSLTRRDRRFLIWFLLYYLFGFISNYTRTSKSVSEPVQLTVAILSSLALLAWLVHVVWGLMRSRYTGDDLGLVIDTRRSWVLAAVASMYVVLVFLRFPLLSLGLTPVFPQIVAAAIVEEILFRPLLINILHKMLARYAHPLGLAVVVSAAAWALVHVPSKPFSQVVGIFIGGWLFGGLYAYSRSNVVGFVVHATANAGGLGGVVTFLLYLLVSPWVGRRQRLAVQSEGAL